jgi:hypothetical protein
MRMKAWAYAVSLSVTALLGLAASASASAAGQAVTNPVTAQGPAAAVKYSVTRVPLSASSCATIDAKLKNAGEAPMNRCEFSLRLVYHPLVSQSAVAPDLWVTEWLQAELCGGDPPSWWTHSSISCSEEHFIISGYFRDNDSKAKMSGSVHCSHAATTGWSISPTWCGSKGNDSTLLKMGQDVNYSAPDQSGTAWLRIDIPGKDWGQDPYLAGGWDHT